MVIRSWANRPKRRFDPIGGKKLVEKAGYVPAKKRIEDMIAAGFRLQQIRAEQFDTVDNKVSDDDLPVIPSRKPGFDLAEGHQIMSRVSNLVKKVKVKLKADSLPVEPKKPDLEPKKEGV